MPLAAIFVSVHLFLRFLLGLILVSVAVSKWRHRRQFRQGIQEYQVIPHQLEQSMALSTLFAMCIPLAEFTAGLGLITGLFLFPALVLAICLFTLFSYALILNLVKGRTDLSCHCGGTLGDHSISWWLVGRNVAFITCILAIFITSSDPFTIDIVFHKSFSINASMWVNTALPIALLALGVLVAFTIFNALYTSFRL